MNLWPSYFWLPGKGTSFATATKQLVNVCSAMLPPSWARLCSLCQQDTSYIYVLGQFSLITIPCIGFLHLNYYMSNSTSCYSFPVPLFFLSWLPSNHHNHSLSKMFLEDWTILSKHHVYVLWCELISRNDKGIIFAICPLLSSKFSIWSPNIMVWPSCRLPPFSITLSSMHKLNCFHLKYFYCKCLV